MLLFVGMLLTGRITKKTVSLRMICLFFGIAIDLHKEGFALCLTRRFALSEYILVKEASNRCRVQFLRATAYML